MVTDRATTPLLGFLVMEKTTREDGDITALMITDNRGYPLEFKATTPVCPSLAQKTFSLKYSFVSRKKHVLCWFVLCS